MSTQSLAQIGRRIGFPIVLALLLLTATAIHPSPIQAPQTGEAQIDMGSVNDSVYTNSFFGMSYELPKNWYVDKLAMDADNSNAKQFLARGAPAGYQSFSLLKISQNPADGLRVRGPRLNLDVTSAPPKDVTARGVLSGTKRLLSQQPTAQIIRDLTDCSFGGHAFVRMDVEWRLPGGNVAYEGDAVTIVKGYLVQFQILADSPEQLNDLFGTFNSLKFTP